MVVKEIERTIEKEDDSWLEVWSFKPAYVFPLEYTDMPMLQTAIKHFEEDIERAKELIKVTENLPDGIAKDDVLRAAWMMAVGACDAYFCDAYGDLIARTLRAKDNERGIKLPDRLNHLKIPVIAVINPSINDGWRWRMAARELIEKESVLSLKEIKDLFNQFFSDDNKILNQDTIESWGYT